jgi:5-methylcytosine-specific restriction endonuclease McrA
MSAFPSMPLFVADFLIDTRGLRPDEKWYYMEILMLTWARKCRPLPDDPERMALALGITKGRWLKRVRPQLERFFNLTEDTWRPLALEGLAWPAESRRRNIPYDVRWEVWRASRGHCHYCGTPVVYGGFGPSAFSIDHVHPLIQGGNDDLDNLVGACMGCNIRKAGRTPAEWRARQ